MSKNIEAKKVLVDDITAKIQQSKSVVVVNYNGLSVYEDTELRNAFRKENIEYKVLKNTLIKRAFNNLGVTAFDLDLNGTTSIAFDPSETTSSRIVVESEKKYNGKISAKSAYLDGAYINVAGVKSLAAIPSKTALIGQLAGVLSATIGGLAVAIKAIAEKNAELA